MFGPLFTYRCVSLDTSRVDAYSLFPGQIVLCEASNPSGSRLVATSLVADASPELPAKPDRLVGAPLSVVASSGPYTTSDNLCYEPLRDLLRYLESNRPHLAILAGPFVDARHDLVAGGTGLEEEEAFDDTFKRVLRMIAETAKEIPSTQVPTV